MAGLNDELEIELEGKGNSDVKISDYAIPNPKDNKPSTKQPDALPLTFMAMYGDQAPPTEPENIPSIQELFGNDVVPGEVPNLKANIVLIEQNSNTISDATTKRDEVVLINAISKEDIEELNTLLPGLVNEELPLSFYTETPTQTNFTSSVSRVNALLGRLKESQAVLTSDACAQTQLAISQAQNYVISSFTSKIEGRVNHSVNLLSSINDVKNKPSTNSTYEYLVNLFKLNLESFASSDFTKLNEKIVLLNEAIRENRSFHLFVNEIVGSGERIDDVVLWQYMTIKQVVTDINTTLVEMLKFIVSAFRDDVSGSLISMLSKAEVKLRESTSQTYDGVKGEPLSGFQTKSDILSEQSYTVNKVIQFVQAMNKTEQLLFETVSEIFSLLNAVPYEEPTEIVL